MATGAKTGGRKKGTPNKLTANVKTALINAFEKAGGEEYLLNVARDDPKTFCSLLGRIIPTEISGPDGNPVSLIERVIIRANKPE